MLAPIYINDKQLAHLLSMSPEWVRAQRFKRKRGEDHFLDLEPRFIASRPRYVAAEVDAFLASIERGGRR